MFGLSSSELLFYGGIAIIAVAVVIALICIIIFSVSGSRLKKKLNQEYGKPRS